MKTSTQHLPEATPAERLDRAFRIALTVSKDELLKEEAKEKRRSQKKRDKKPI